MTYRFPKQAFRHDPAAGIYGDCHRTATACMLGTDRDDVPHFFHDGEDPSGRMRAEKHRWTDPMEGSNRLLETC